VCPRFRGRTAGRGRGTVRGRLRVAVFIACSGVETDLGGLRIGILDVGVVFGDEIRMGSIGDIIGCWLLVAGVMYRGVVVWPTELWLGGDGVFLTGILDRCGLVVGVDNPWIVCENSATVCSSSLVFETFSKNSRTVC
jgi:hypothetical protein